MAVNSASNSVFSNYTKNSVKIQSKEKTEKADNSKLSDKAKQLLVKLQEKFGDVNFIIGDFNESETANYSDDSDKQYNCFISTDLLEQMAADEETAKKYEGVISDAMNQVEKVKQEAVDNGADKYIKSYGVKIDKDGNVSFFTLLKDNLPLYKDKDDNIEKSNNTFVKGNSIEELLKKLNEVSQSIKETEEILGTYEPEKSDDKHNYKGKGKDIFINNDKESIEDAFKSVKGRKDGFDIRNMLPENNHKHSAATHKNNKKDVNFPGEFRA